MQGADVRRSPLHALRTFALQDANSSTVARPIPLVPPVIKQSFPSRPLIFKQPFETEATEPERYVLNEQIHDGFVCS